MNEIIIYLNIWINEYPVKDNLCGGRRRKTEGDSYYGWLILTHLLDNWLFYMQIKATVGVVRTISTSSSNFH